MAHDPRKLDADALQDHTRSLRSLARAIVGDRNDADDLVQDAWVTALDRPVKEGWSIGSWLRGITRNHARQQRRDEGRRVRREQAAAVPERQPPDDSIERIDLLRHLLDNVKDLDEPFRSTVLMRYFDGVEPKEIARRLGVPHATIRTRLHRGIEQLRQRMDDSVGGDRRAWVLPLIPFVSVPDLMPVAPLAEAATQATTQVGHGLFAMSVKKQLAALGVVLAGALLTVTFWPGSDEPIDADKPTGSLHASKSDDQQPGTKLQGEKFVPAVNDRREEVVGEPLEEKPSGKSKKLTLVDVAGTVRTNDGEPIAGATVRFGKKTTKTLSDGTYSLTRTPAKGDEAGQVWIFGFAQAEGFASTDRSVHAKLGNGSVQVDFKMHKGVLVVGRVLTQAGQGIAGARVRSFTSKHGRGTTTNANGEFRLDDVDPAKPNHYLYAEARGYVASGAVLSVAGKADEPVKIVLRRGAVVRGVVFGPNRKPVAFATIKISGGKKGSKTKSDQKGTFELVGIEPGKHALSVAHPDFVPHQRLVQVPEPGQDLDLVIELLQGDTLTGFVRDEAGKPVAKATVRFGSQKTPSAKGVSDEQGAFELRGVPPGNIEISCNASGFLARRTKTASAIRGIVITLARSAGIAGRVVDARTGQPIRAFSVRFLAKETKRKRKSTNWSEDFDNEEGLWSTRWLDLPVGFVTDVEVRAKGYAPAVRERVMARLKPDPDQVRIALDAGTTLTGRVVADIGSAPVAGAMVRIVHPHTALDTRSFVKQEHRFARTNATGAFAFEHVGHGTFHLAVKHPDWGLSLHPITIAPGTESTSKTLVLGKQGSLTGVALDSASQPVAGAPIRLTMVGVRGIRDRSWNTKTDKNGKYAFSRLVFGDYRVARIEKQGKQFETVARFVRITNTLPRRIDLDSGGGGSVHGMAKGFTAGWLLVTLTPEDPEGTDWEKRRTPRQALSQASMFTLQHVVAGTYRVEARVFPKGEGQPMRGEGKITIEAGKPNPLTIELKPDPDGGKK